VVLVLVVLVLVLVLVVLVLVLVLVVLVLVLVRHEVVGRTQGCVIGGFIRLKTRMCKRMRHDGGLLPRRELSTPSPTSSRARLVAGPFWGRGWFGCTWRGGLGLAVDVADGVQRQPLHFGPEGGRGGLLVQVEQQQTA
jgi:hypothetical protein